MGIFSRIVRIFKADIHGVMDQLEDKSLLLKQYLREMEEAMDQNKSCLSKIIETKKATLKEISLHKKNMENLDKEITLAIAKEKDDVARLLIKKLKGVKNYHENAENHIKILDSEISTLKETIEKQQIEHDHVALKSEEYFHIMDLKKMEKNFSDIIPSRFFYEASDDEVDFELSIRKESIRGGV